MKRICYWLLPALILLTLFSRTYGMNWDQGYHLHPDERAIILFTIKLQFPTTLASFFSVDSPWNPHFFAYGSLPLYVLYALSSLLGKFFPFLAAYDGIQYVGRSISALADTGIVVLLFFLGRKLVSEKVGLLAACLYFLSTFALQAAHFYAVDTLLTFFCLSCLFFLVSYLKTHTFKKLLGYAVFLGFAVATKVSAILLIFPCLITLAFDATTIWKRQTEQRSLFSRFLRTTSSTGVKILIILAVGLFTFAICEPYAFIDFKEFVMQTQQQSEMTKSAWTFPYTLQYVGIIPYLYEIKQIFFWGQGPLLAGVCFLGIIWGSIYLYKHPEKKYLSVLLSFFWLYFAVVGSFAVGFMRYMLPLYPLLCLFGALGVWHVLAKQTIKIKLALLSLLVLLCSILPISFIHIYTADNPRVQATNWILEHIPPGKNFAIEHWDDQLPLKNAELYPFQTLALYDPDTQLKWDTITQQLQTTDYIILASNRLYTPLQKLTDCPKFMPHPCYTRTAQYYQDLFSGKLGFTKVAEFSSYPTIPVINLPLTDQSADESFTVYDHPKVQIFQKM